jgi:hypothetical protein
MMTRLIGLMLVFNDDLGTTEGMQAATTLYESAVTTVWRNVRIQKIESVRFFVISHLTFIRFFFLL